jgi:pimeloyl-ACP methyl ester carboxylesterase
VTGQTVWWLAGGRPDVVLLHGFSDDADCWIPLLPEFAGLGGLGGVLAVDARGHGASPLPAGPVGPAPQAADTAAVLEALRLARPVVLIGHSMGAVTAAHLAAERPDLVAALVLEDPPPHAYDDGHPRGMPDWLAAARALPEPALVAACRQENPDWPEAERVPWARAKIRLNPEYCYRETVPAPPLSATLSAVTCPVLLLHGAPARGGMNSAQDVAAMREACAGPFTSVAFDQAGHTPRREARESYVSEVRSWLAATAHRGPTPHPPHSE